MARMPPLDIAEVIPSGDTAPVAAPREATESSVERVTVTRVATMPLRTMDRIARRDAAHAAALDAVDDVDGEPPRCRRTVGKSPATVVRVVAIVAGPAAHHVPAPAQAM